jgi:Flp pilus assembly protein TadD
LPRPIGPPSGLTAAILPASLGRAAELRLCRQSDETEPHAQFQKGQILLYRRRYDEARFHIDRAAQLNRYDPDVITVQAFYAVCR